MSKKPRPSLPSRNAAANTGHGYWVYGWHAVQAALANPERIVKRIAVSAAAKDRLVLPRKLPQPEVMEPRALDHLLGNDAVHQGIGAFVQPLPGYVLEDVLHKPAGMLLILDQVSDPHNVGAILRSAAAFGAVGVITPKDHSAPETAVMAKTASGALDIVPRVTVTNLANAIRELQQEGWWVIGLAGEATQNLSTIKPGQKMALVLGAEGKGMRRLTADSCDELARLPIDPRMESLNVSNAAAVALYHFYAQANHG